MLKITNKPCKFIWISIYLLLVIFLGIIIVLSVTEPQNNLFPWQMTIGTALGTIFMLAAFFLWQKLPCKRIKHNPYLYAILLILFGILLYAANYIGRNAYWSFYDYQQIYTAALQLSAGKELSSELEFYFSTYANNIKPMLYLSILFRIANFLHFSDPFYLILLISVLEVLGAVWSVGILAGPAEDRAEMRIPILFMFVFTLPIWGNVQHFYTDSMSFTMGIMGIALFRLAFETLSRWKSIMYLILAGISTGLGMTIKITVLIPIIAGFIVFCFYTRLDRKWKCMCLFFFSTAIAYALTSLWAGQFTIWEMQKSTSDPIIHWIALGMKGNGSWGDNREFVTYINTLSTKQEKTAYSLQYIWTNRSDFWNLSHLAQKVRYNFACGHFGATIYNYYALKENNLIWELFAPFGKYYWRTSQYSFCWIFSIYTINMLGAAVTLYHLIKGKAVSAIKAVADLALLGNIIFLMIWEANNRQLYNQLPIILLGAVLNMRLLVRQLSHISPLSD